MSRIKFTTVAPTSVIIAALFLFLIAIHSSGYSAEYEYDRLWPSLQQPWYFNQPQGIVVEQKGGVLIVDAENARVQKFSSNGQLLTEWGIPGDQPGEFERPTDIALDSGNDIYVTDTFNHRVQVFTSDGEFIRMFGEIGSGPGQFNGPEGIVVDKKEYVYVADAPNFRVSVFEADGSYLYSWGVFGDGPGQFKDPSALALSSQNTILVADGITNRVQQFLLDGTFLNQWGGTGETEGLFNRPTGLATDSSGTVYVADFGNRRIQQFDLAGEFLGLYDTGDKFTQGITAPDRLAVHPDGSLYVTARVGSRVLKFSSQQKFLNEWSSRSALPGHFDTPWGISIGPSGDVFATDSFNHRVQRFTAEGRLVLQWGEEGEAPGTFKVPYGVASGPEGDIYVTDLVRDTVHKFTPDGVFVLEWGGEGIGDGEFNAPSGIATSATGDVFIADAGNNRIQQFDADGLFIRAFGSVGDGAGELDNPFGVTVDGEGFVYVADTRNSRIQKYAATGEFLLGWGSEGDAPGQFQDPSGVTTDPDGRIYVADSRNHRVQIFTPDGELLNIFGSQGTNPGQFFRPETLAIADDGTSFVLDTYNSRIQRFVIYEPNQNKAIVVAGGDLDASPDVLRAAEMCTNVAYRALLQQGYSKETIFFIRSRTDVDLDQNGFFDDVDAVTSSENLEGAIVEWAREAGNLVLFLVGPGETGGFRLNASELVAGAQLDAWLDELQQTMAGTVLTVYDASFAGGFLPALAPSGGQKRVTVASTASTEPAHFVADGTVSYSNLFWVEAFNGGTLQDAAARASTNLSGISKFQTPEVDGDGNGVPNEPSDVAALEDLLLLFESLSENLPPELGTLTEPQILVSDDSTAEFALDTVFDDEGVVSLVRGVITPPGTGVPAGGESITGLPTVDLFVGENNAFSGSSSLFTEPGTYTVDFYALDANLNISDIKQTTVTKAEISASIVGVVFDSDTRLPVLTAEVAIQRDGDRIGTASVDEHGAYTVLNLEHGSYRLSVDAPGYVSQAETVSVAVGDAAVQSFELVREQIGDVSASPSALNFGQVTVGESSDMILTLTNGSESELAGTIASTAPFELRSGASYTMATGASHTMTVRFTPVEAKVYTATMLVAEGGGLSISMRGTGVTGTSTMDCAGVIGHSAGGPTASLGDWFVMVLVFCCLLSIGAIEQESETSRPRAMLKGKIQ